MNDNQTYICVGGTNEEACMAKASALMHFIKTNPAQAAALHGYLLAKINTLSHPSRTSVIDGLELNSAQLALYALEHLNLALKGTLQ